MSLSKTETAILANAARRNSRNLLPLPRFIYVRGLAVVIAIERLLRFGLVAERQAQDDEPVWRKGRTPMTLVLSEQGLAALHEAPLDPGQEEDIRISAELAPTADTHAPTTLAVSEDDRHWVLMSIMSRPHGADVKLIQRETGLPLQTIRSAINTLRAEGYVFDHVREPDGTITYQLIGWLPGEGGLEFAQPSGLLHS
ncbi:MAG: hypothetical protein GC201_04540 [Alphaproteobacteria bacterium]|nr:hypothetical protein [Alphaproteobacteria bacterium]